MKGPWRLLPSEPGSLFPTVPSLFALLTAASLVDLHDRGIKALVQRCGIIALRFYILLRLNELPSGIVYIPLPPPPDPIHC